MRRNIEEEYDEIVQELEIEYECGHISLEQLDYELDLLDEAYADELLNNAM